MQTNLLFVEEQYFNQKWITGILVLFFLIFFWAIIQQELFDIPFGNNPISSVYLFLFGLIPFAFLILLQKTKMITKIYTEGISVKIKPFHLKQKIYNFDEIESIYTREYKPIAEFGGWGIRIGLKGKAYNMNGNMGLQLELKNGKKVLIGSQKPLELETVIRKYTSAQDLFKS